jgi:3-methyl-2-oxobutanoate hydroxymethyltransferase
MLGLSFGKLARFVRPYANLHQVMTEAVTRYADDVRNGTYPSEAESYALPADAASELKLDAATKDSSAKESRTTKS